MHQIRVGDGKINPSCHDECLYSGVENLALSDINVEECDR